MKILCVIPVLPGDLNEGTIESILKQTVPVTEILITSRRTRGKTVSQRVSRNLNLGLAGVELACYDYLLRVDGDTVLPRNFVEENLRDKPDLCGSAGCAMLIKTEPFLRVMGGKFHSESDDSYTGYAFMRAGCRVMDWKVKPKMLRPPGNYHGPRYFLDRGRFMWCLGYEPLHVLASFRWQTRNVIAVFGYFAALLRREKKFDVADFVWARQVEKLWRLKFK